MITSQEMRQLEDNCGIPKQVIMENAGRGVADILRKKFDILNKQIQILDLEAVDFSDYDIIIDAIFGTGIRGEIKDPLATLITNLNKAKAFKVSVDIQSGVNPDTGEKANVSFEPDLIITMHDIKKGLENFKDKTVVVDIGIKKDAKE